MWSRSSLVNFSTARIPASAALTRMTLALGLMASSAASFRRRLLLPSSSGGDYVGAHGLFSDGVEEFCIHALRRAQGNDRRRDLLVSIASLRTNDMHRSLQVMVPSRPQSGEFDIAWQSPELAVSVSTRSGQQASHRCVRPANVSCLARLRTGGPGHLQSYERQWSRRADDRSENTAALGRRTIERARSPERSVTGLRNPSISNAGSWRTWRKGHPLRLAHPSMEDAFRLPCPRCSAG